MPEWLIGAVSKTVVLARVPGVQIPLPPLHKKPVFLRRVRTTGFFDRVSGDHAVTNVLNRKVQSSQHDCK